MPLLEIFDHDSEDNPSGINAEVSVLQNPKENFYNEENLIIENVLANQNFNELDSIVKDYDDSPLNPVSIIPAGYADIQFNVSKGDLPVNLQLFSRVGNHIAGKSFELMKFLLKKTGWEKII